MLQHFRTFTDGLRGAPAATGTMALAFFLLATATAPASAQTTGFTAEAASAFTQSFLVMLREGAEAVLIIAALWVVLRQMGAADRMFRALLAGAGGGIAASLALAWAFSGMLAANPAIAEIFEGVALVLAAVVLLFVSSWLLGRREAEKWRDRIRQGARRAVAGGSVAALAAAGFLVIFREGAETVLFYQAITSGTTAGLPALVAGGIAALVVLAAAALLVRSFGLRLPLRGFFTVTAWSLFALAVIYAGKGVHELQEAGWITETALAGMPKVKLLGVYPYVETLLAQIATLITGLMLNLRATRPAAGGQPAE